MSIKEKILALLKKAESSEHQAERDAFMSKVSQLLEKHQLDLFDIHEVDPIGTSAGVEAQSGPSSYKSKVQCALAKLYGAVPVINHTAKDRWVVDLNGPESSRTTTILMTDFVWDQVKTEAGKIAKASGRDKGAVIRDVAKALVQRIRIEVAARKPASQEPTGSALSLVIVDQVKVYVDDRYAGALRQIKGKSKGHTRSAAEAASSISLNVQVGSGATTLRLT